MTDAQIIPFPVEPQGDFLPVTLGGGDLRCSRCGTGWHPRTWHVSPGAVADDAAGTATSGTPVCPACARQSPALLPWQLLCDAFDDIDAAMVAAGSFNRRAILADMVERYAGHLARWRADDAEMAKWEQLDADRFTERYGPQPTVVDIRLTVDGEPTDDDRAAAVALVRAGLHEDEAGFGAVLRSVGETGNAAPMFGAVLGMCIKLGVLAFGSAEAFDEELVERLDDLLAREVEG